MYGRCRRDAQECANDLALQLGKGWKPIVWENLGWCYSANTVDGTMAVHANTQSYTAFFNRKRQPCNMSRGNWAASGNTPQEAVAAVLKIVHDEIDTINEALASYKQATEGKGA